MKVVFLERMIPDYRTRVFEMLHERLSRVNIDFHLVMGQMRKGEDLNELPPVGEWAHRIKNVYLHGNIHWPRFERTLDNADMVIFHPQNAALGNLRILARRQLRGKPKIGFFGHGSNIPIVSQGGALSAKERFKAWIASMPDWWFPYTDMSLRLLRDRQVQFPRERMTVVNNSIDTTAITNRLKAFPENTRSEFRAQLGIQPNDPVGLYCGRMRAMKLGILFDAALKIRRLLPNFHLILIGKGEAASDTTRFAQENNWAHYVGPQYGDARLPYFLASDAFLMPGLVGLAILDAFAAGLPLFTTDCRIHSPEIEYLKTGENGIITAVNATEYAAATFQILSDRTKLSQMSSSARYTAGQVTMERMADNFVSGIRGCLGAR